jgi:hypothetical protein
MYRKAEKLKWESNVIEIQNLDGFVFGDKVKPVGNGTSKDGNTERCFLKILHCHKSKQRGTVDSLIFTRCAPSSRYKGRN